MNARGAIGAAGEAPAAEGPRKCPHCGMETKSTLSCDWCSKAIEPPKPILAPERGMAEVAAVMMANSPDAELESGPLGKRVLHAARMVISEPTRAVNGGLETFINSPGAALAVLALYVVTLLPGMITFSSEEFSRPGAPDPPIPLPLLGLLIPLASLFISSFVIAIYNSLTGNSDSIVGDWGALVLSFAFVTATVTLFCLPVTLTLALTGNMGVLGIGWMVALVAGIWILILEIMVVVSSSVISGFVAFILLGFANGVSGFAVRSALAALVGEQRGY